MGFEKYYQLHFNNSGIVNFNGIHFLIDFMKKLLCIFLFSAGLLASVYIADAQKRADHSPESQ